MASLSSRPLLATRADTHLFLDREPEIERALRAIKRGYNVAIIGDPGSGKTSLLHRLFLRAREEPDVLPGLCDASPYRDQPLGFLKMLLDALGTRSELTEELKLLELLGESLAQASKGKRLAFLIDNLGEPQSAEMFRKSFASLRDSLWSLEAVFVVTVDAREEPQLLRPPVSSFFEVAVRLEDFDLDSVRKLLARRGFAEDGAAERIFGVVGGNPRAVIELARRIDLGEVAPEALEELAGRVSEEGDASDLSARLLRYLATHGQASASDPELQEAMGVTRARLTQVLSELSARRAIEGIRQGRKVYYRLQSSGETRKGET